MHVLWLDSPSLLQNTGNVLTRGVTVHKCEGSVRTSVLTSWFGMLSVQQGEKLNVKKKLIYIYFLINGFT